MQRVTITLDDDLLETLDSLSQRRGYNNRSEAIRDILRSALAQEATQQHGTQGFAVLSYVFFLLIHAVAMKIAAALGV